MPAKQFTKIEKWDSLLIYSPEFIQAAVSQVYIVKAAQKQL